MVYQADINLIYSVLDAKTRSELAQKVAFITTSGRGSINNDGSIITPSRASILLFGEDVTLTFGN